jgi:hypothetical protein
MLVAARPPMSSGRAIHWHADPMVRIECVATDGKRQTMPYVRVTNRDGRTKGYLVEGATPEQLVKGE